MANTLIIGTGIIGLSTAYYLLPHQPASTIHLIDASPTLFASASGYAGGFLAKDWFPPSLTPLGELSYAEHAKLAKEHGGEKWGYAKTVTLSYDPRGRRVDGRRGEDWLLEGTSRAELVREREESVKRGDIPRWLRRSEGDTVSVVDNGEGTAILDPLKLCQFLLEKVTSAGVQIHNPATALSLTTTNNVLTSVRIRYITTIIEKDLPCTRLLIAAGAWTPTVFKTLFPASPVQLAISSLAGHSLVIRNPAGAPEVCHSVYCSLDGLSPEMYARKNGVVYIAGLNSSSTPLPMTATGCKPTEAGIEILKGIAAQLIASDTELEVLRTGLCFRPITKRGTPYVTRVDDGLLGVETDGGVFLAAGHGPWGVSLCLGTGRVVGEMMLGREVSVDISGLGL